MTQIIVWPRELLPPAKVSMRPRNLSVTGGRSPAAGEQRVLSPSPYWEAKLTDFGIFTPDQVRTFRALIWGLGGRSGNILMPVWDGPHSPAGYPTTTLWNPATPWDPSTPWGDVPATNIVLAADAAERATSIDVSWTGAAPQAGQYFSIGQSFDGISMLISTGTTTATLKLPVPLRAAYLAGTSLNFDDPRCLMCLATDDEGELALEAVSRGSPSLWLVEALPVS